MTATVAIVGRPNTGKSTLFNRFVGTRRALESDIPGTTRDRLYHTVDLGPYSVLFVDTGGLELDRHGSIEANVQEQTKAALLGADVIVFVVDVREELTSEDFHAAQLLRKSKKPVILVANKCDNPRFEDYRYNLYELGFGEPVAVTALHAIGMDELENRIEKELKRQKIKPEKKTHKDENRIRISFLGRPNTGKSTLVNALFGKKVVVTSEIPGTTRDATETPFEYKNQKFMLVDTAGIRRRGRIEKGLEQYSILRSLQAVEQSDVCVLLLDANEGVTSQDCHVTQYILEQKKGLILVVNKMDLWKGRDREEKEHQLIHDLQREMAYLPWAPVVFASGLERKNIFQILELAKEISEERKRLLAREALRIWLDLTLKKHPPKGSRGKHRFSIHSVEQVDILPPTFVFYCQWPEIMHFSYGRYLENELRAQFGFVGTAIRLIFRKPSDVGSRRATKFDSKD